MTLSNDLLSMLPEKADCLYLVPVGSRLYGTDVETSDYDFKGILRPSRLAVLGLGGKEGSDAKREGCVDGNWAKVEVTTYSARKWVELCLKGNPTLIETAFASSHAVTRDDAFVGPLLKLVQRGARNVNTAKAYLGYITSQHSAWLERILEWESFRRAPESRKTSYEMHGHDPKLIAHVLRLCFQLTELLESGAINPRLSGSQRELILYARNGVPSRDEIEEVAKAAVFKVNDLVTDRLPTLPVGIDPTEANWALVRFHERCFAWFGDDGPERTKDFIPFTPKDAP